jgi:acetyl esterase/lipase
MPTLRAHLTRFLIKQIAGRKYRKIGTSVADLREMDALVVRTQRPPKGTQVEAISLDGLPAEWITGPGATSDAVILSLHGGAFVTGSPAANRELAARVSVSTGFRVLSPDYRLAPEHPFPAALEDTLQAYRWLLDQGVSHSRLVLGGESSGGGLALQALLSLKEQGLPSPVASFFLSPVTEWFGLDGESYSTRAALDPLVFRAMCDFTASQYVGDHPSDTPLLRPWAMDLTGLPPMWIQVGDYEVLLSDAQRLAEHAAEAGVAVDFKVWPGLWHVFQGAARWVPEAQQSLDELGEFVKGKLEEQ